MGRPERPLDPEAGPVERLAWELRRLRNEAGRPSYRELARRAHFSRSTLAEAATGVRLPTLEATLAYAGACGGDRDEWERRWREVAAEVERDRRRCPYPGLAPLQEGDADLFFGRSELVEDLLEAVERAPLTAVFGASGSGKSSILRAGLLPGLAGTGTPTVLLTPGEHPLDELAAALAPLAGSDLETALAADPPEPPVERAFVVVDQFEEVFTLCADEERDRFLDVLTALAGDRLRFVIGVRTDFYGHCARHPGLVAALRAGVQVPVGPLTDEELRDIVVEPAARVGLTVEPDLVATVVAEAAGRPGALPLVAHALRETWSRAPGPVLRLADYEATGGVREAIARTAERVHEDLDPPRRALARAVFLRLTALGEGTEDTRRRMDRDELTGVGEPGEVDAVLDVLAAARLVVVDGDTVDVAHEALIRAWPRLRGWLTDDREALLRHHRLTAAAAEWDRGGRDEEFLYRGGRLAEWDGATVPLNELERSFLAAGREREEHRRVAARRRVRAGFGGLGLVAAVVGVLAVVAFVQADRTAQERDRALSRQLAANARRQLDIDPELALLLATRAYEVEATPEADLVLRQAVRDARLRRTVPLPGMRPSSDGAMVSSPDRRRVAIWDQNGLQVMGWRGADLVPGGGFNAARLPGAWTAAAFSPDGRWLATGDVSGRVKLWDGQHRTTGRQLRGEGGPGVGGLDFSPDGRRLAGTRGNEVWIWDLAGKREPVVFRVHERFAVSAVAFSPDGRWLATGGIGTSVRIWDVTGNRPRVVRDAARGGPDERDGDAVAFSPGGTMLAAVDRGKAKVWSVPGRPERGGWEPQAVLDGTGQGAVKGLTVSADGRRMATFGLDRVVRVWTMGADLGPLTLRVPVGAQVGAAFSPDGRSLATVSTDGTARIFDIASGGVATSGTPFTGEAAVGAIRATSADGRTVATTPLGGDTVRVWDTARGGAPRVVAGPAGSTRAVALSPDGRWLAYGGDGHAVHLVDLRDRAAPPVTVDTGHLTVWALAFGPGGRRLAATGYGTAPAQVWDVGARGGLTPLPGWGARPGQPGALGRAAAPAFSPDGRFLAGAAEGNAVGIWDLTGKRKPTILRGLRDDAETIAFSPDGRRLAVASDDGSVRLMDTGGRGAPTAVLPGDDTIVTRDLAFSPDGAWLATTESDGSLRLWRTAGGTDPVVLDGFGGTVVRPAFAPGGRLVAPLGSASVLTGGRWRPTGITGRFVRTWDCEVCGPGAKVLELARRRAVRELTGEEKRIFPGS
ncbi:nSTAND1 domain-containing NTPase [Actinomadura terrae]|uniref:nSTAND1 domain-containing NTPase n=1 Tax=Actinomadura terrae TaxID=604353 RepID=UPI001FA79E8A|nr:hypothetical protein [Actinomadura terrae]